ncbi:MAG: acetylxylan esterase [Bacteroidia bacterium]|nr:acetylxylan esterase [Bacteroidia bacterium]
MKKIEKFELLIEGEKNVNMTADLTLPVSKTPVPVVVFCHGFKGFKDWGHFNWVANSFAENGLAFLKFNFSHNGIKSDNLLELSDMEAFGNNNYSIELNDLDIVISFIDKNSEKYNINPREIYLVGHSRGGGIALLKGCEDKRVKRMTLWASLSEFDSFFRPKTIETWNAIGVVYAENKRTGQQLPLKKQFYDDYLANKSKLDIKKAAKLLDKPLLIIHGEKDESVDISHAENLYNIVQHSILIKVEDGDHTFGAKHPFDEANDVTPMLEELVENTVEFFLD